MPTLMAPVEPTTPVARRTFDVPRYMVEEIDRLFNEFGLRDRWPFFQAPAKGASTWMPAVEVDEKDGKLRVRLDLPGMKKEDVKVDIAEGMLTIEGERKHEAERKEKDYYRTERSYGRFARTLVLPEGAKIDTATATFADGVLEISMDVRPAEQPAARRLAIG